MKKIDLLDSFLMTIGTLLSGIFICSITIGINFSITTALLIIGLLFVTLIVFTEKTKKNNFIYFGLIMLAFYYFNNAGLESTIVNWKDKKLIMSSDLKKTLTMLALAIACNGIWLGLFRILKLSK